jgi:uncharacterized integral membrane protein
MGMPELIIILLFVGGGIFLYRILFGRSDVQKHTETSQRFQDSLTDEEKRSESNRTVLKWVAIPVGILFVVFVALSQGGESDFDTVDESAVDNPSPEQVQACMEAPDPSATCSEIIERNRSGDYLDYDPVTGEPLD